MPPIIRPPFSPIASPARTGAQGSTPAGVTVVSRDRRFTVTASKAQPVQESHGNRPPDMEHLAKSFGLEPLFGAQNKRPRVYTLEMSSAAEGTGQTPVPYPPSEQ